jgi:hypothetical protein
VSAPLKKRFDFRSANDVKSFHMAHADEIYLRLKQLGSFAINPCDGPKYAMINLNSLNKTFEML